MSDNINNKLPINIETPEKKKTAYASDLTDTLGHKLGKNQIETYIQKRLTDGDYNAQNVYKSEDGLTIIAVDKENEDTTKPILSPTTDKILTLILTKLNENFNGTNRVYLKNITAEELMKKTTVTITLSDYMESTGISDKKTARENLKRASNELYNKSITHTFPIYRIRTDKKGKQKQEPINEVVTDFRLLDAKAQFKSGDVVFYLSQRATPYLTEYSVNYNPKLLKADIRTYQHAYKIGDYLNRQYERTKSGNNNGKISVLKLIDNCDIPSVNEVENRKYKQKIKTPLLESLDHLKRIDVIGSYSFHDKQGNVYSRYDSVDLPINEFVNLILDYTML